LPKLFLCPHYSGPQELGGPGSLNRLNPRFLRHCRFACSAETNELFSLCVNALLWHIIYGTTRCVDEQFT